MPELSRLFLCLLWFLLPTSLVAAEPQSVVASSASTAVQASAEHVELVSRYEQQIIALESRLGPYDQSLSESLQGLGNAYRDIGDYASAKTYLGRRLQVTRISMGLTSFEQIPLLEEIIANDIRLSDWDAVSEHFEFLLWLQTQNPEAELPARMAAMNDVSHWRMAAVYLKTPRSRVRNFLEARQTQEELVDMAEDAFGDTPALVPWLYEDALNQHRLYAMLESEDELGYDADEYIRRIELMEGKDYLRRGLHVVKRMEEILRVSGNLEAEAMAMIYEADFQRLLDLGTAFKLYREAIAKLQDAGVSEADIEEYFATPAVLPVQQFYSSMRQALDNRQQVTSAVDTDGLDSADFAYNLGEFSAWNKSLLFSRLPALPEKAAGLELLYYQVDIRFSVSSTGDASNPKLLRSESVDAGPSPRRVREAVMNMVFRPQIVAGKNQRARDVFMRVSYPVPP